MEEISTVIVPYSGYKKGWNVIVYNDNHNTFENVIGAFIATGLASSVEDATVYATNIHESGYVAIHVGELERMARVIEMAFRSVGIQSEAFYEETGEKNDAPASKKKKIGFGDNEMSDDSDGKQNRPIGFGRETERS
jgi:ATP-dependent Clp protease adapter protein ClpS